MVTLRRPSKDDLDALRARRTDFSYAEVGATRGVGAERPASLARAYDYDRRVFELGRGEPIYRRACDALRDWRHFRGVRWLSFHRGGAPAHEGQVVISLVRVAGLWFANPCRVVYTRFDAETATETTFDFAYGTLPGHVESGEERFRIALDAATGEVTYEILAFSRPALWQTRLGYPFARRMQRRFAEASARALREALGSADHAERILVG